MAVKVILSEDGNGIEILASGVVRGYDVIKANEIIVNNVRLKNIKYQLIDKSKCTEYALTAKDIKKISELDKITATANPDIIMAIVESEALHFSLTELWQAHTEEHKLKNNSFKNREMALEWINSHLDKTQKK